MHCLNTIYITTWNLFYQIDYDVLIIAVGATTNTFNTPGVEENCFFLKQIEDAQNIRNVIIDLVETASIPGQPDEEIERLLHIVVVGGGPTGVEFAAEVKDFVREDVAKIYPRIKNHVMDNSCPKPGSCTQHIW